MSFLIKYGSWKLQLELQNLNHWLLKNLAKNDKIKACKQYSINDNTLKIMWKTFFRMKLIFKTKEQECDFIRVLIKMEKFYIFSSRRYSNMAMQTTIRQQYDRKCFKNITKCTMYNWLYRTILSKTLISRFSVQSPFYSS